MPTPLYYPVSGIRYRVHSSTENSETTFFSIQFSPSDNIYLYSKKFIFSFIRTKSISAMIVGEENSFPDDGGVENDSTSSKIKLIPRITISDNTGEVFSCKFSDDGQFLAAGCGDGAIRVFNSQTGVMSFNLQGGSNVSLPTTAMSFRPNNQTGAFFTNRGMLGGLR